jgi:uncharacterized protein YciI
MLFAVLFEDDLARAEEVRSKHMQAHLEFLERNASAVTAAGPLRNESGNPAGGLWLVKADTHNQVERLLREDPFWPTGLRKSVRVLEWKQVYAEGRRLK